jgi:hypothetical protein
VELALEPGAGGLQVSQQAPQSCRTTVPGVPRERRLEAVQQLEPGRLGEGVEQVGGREHLGEVDQGSGGRGHGDAEADGPVRVDQ